MAASICIECGGKVARMLLHCPHCGALCKPDPMSESTGEDPQPSVIITACSECGLLTRVPRNTQGISCGHCNAALSIQTGTADHSSLPSTPRGPDRSTTIQLAKAAQEAGNHDEANRYWTSILECDPLDAEAWIGKGLSAGWKSTLANNRLDETRQAFEKALAIEGLDEELLFKMLFDGVKLAQGLLNHAASHCAEFQQRTDISGMSFSDMIRMPAVDDAYNKKLHLEYGRHARSALALILVSVRAGALAMEVAPREGDYQRYRETVIKCMELIPRQLDAVQKYATLFVHSGIDADIAIVRRAVLDALPEESASKKNRSAALSDAQEKALDDEEEWALHNAYSHTFILNKNGFVKPPFFWFPYLFLIAWVFSIVLYRNRAPIVVPLCVFFFGAFSGLYHKFQWMRRMRLEHMSTDIRND